MFFLLLGVSGCNSEMNNKEISKDEFCSFVNVENKDKTIPFINDFLSGQSDNLDDTQKLQALVAYLKSYPCIIDATLFCVSCIKTLPLQSEIIISFKEGGVIQKYILDISMSKPLKASHYHEMYQGIEINACL